jgi:hypothetical protein
LRAEISDCQLPILEGELRAGHEGGFAELLIQLLRGVVEGAPAFFMGGRINSELSTPHARQREIAQK